MGPPKGSLNCVRAHVHGDNLREGGDNHREISNHFLGTRCSAVKIFATDDVQSGAVRIRVSDAMARGSDLSSTAKDSILIRIG